MAEPGDRFRRLRRPDRGRDDSEPRTGDLFEHFGIVLDPAPVEAAPGSPVEAAPCRGCGWYVPYVRADPACPICADPFPLQRTEPAEAT